MSTFQVGKITIGPPKSSNLVDQMSGKFQMLNAKTELKLSLLFVYLIKNYNFIDLVILISYSITLVYMQANQIWSLLQQCQNFQGSFTIYSWAMS